jgi:hypothetical protein
MEGDLRDRAAIKITFPGGTIHSPTAATRSATARYIVEI